MYGLNLGSGALFIFFVDFISMNSLVSAGGSFEISEFFVSLILKASRCVFSPSLSAYALLALAQGPRVSAFLNWLLKTVCAVDIGFVSVYRTNEGLRNKARGLFRNSWGSIKSCRDSDDGGFSP